jgi:threonine/homoserine/homoserine lactone efflux protein
MHLIPVLLLIVAPGPTNALLAATAAQSGSVRGLIYVALGYSLSLTAYSLVLPQISHLPFALQTMKLLCAIWLAVLAFRCWRASEIRPGGNLFLTTLLNPKAAFIALTLQPVIGGGAMVCFGIGGALVAGVLWIEIGKIARRLGGGSHAAKASSIVSACAAALILASFAP